MLVGLAASALGTLCLATATHVEWLFVGRVFMGVGVGLSAGPATASLVAFNPSGRMSYSATVTQPLRQSGLVPLCCLEVSLFDMHHFRRGSISGFCWR
ncbi:hypothetical protein [Paraburkholderia hospita]